MQKKIITVPNVEFTLETLLTALRMDAECDMLDEIMSLREEALKVAVPAAVYCAVKPDFKDGKVYINGAEFSDRFVYEKLMGCEVVVPYAATCGAEINRWSKGYTDFFEQFIADTIKQLCLNIIRDKLYDEVKLGVFKEAKHVPHLNPGSLNEFPITGQIPLFEAIGGVKEDIGIELTDSMLMEPNKSISGIMFASDKAFESCQLCPRENCEGRRAPFIG